MTVSRETIQLQALASLIRKWNPSINLISTATVDNIENRHIADSLQLAQKASAASGSWLDLGSGGGLPGLVMGVARPELEVTLIESDKRKCSFLRTAVRELGLTNVAILNQRIECAEPANAMNISARALAPLPALLSYVFRHIHADGTAWLMKGRNWHSEVDLAQKFWNFDFTSHSSQTDPEAIILQMTSIRHA